MTTNPIDIFPFFLSFNSFAAGGRIKNSFCFSCRTEINERGCTPHLPTYSGSCDLALELPTAPACFFSFLRTKEGMFQPQPTPYSPFSSYGAVPAFHSFQPSSTGRSGLVIDSGGPTIFRDPIFSPTNVGNANANSAGATNFNNTSLGPQFKMAPDDLEHQEELARSFQPVLHVWATVAN